MNIQTGIAVTLGIVVVGVFFIFPQFSPFGATGGNEGFVAGATNYTNTMATESTTTASGLQIIELAVGTGETVVVGDQISVNYVGMLADGTVFDASANRGAPSSFFIGVGQVIPGWDEGVVGMKEGGKRKLVIPAELAYGANGIPGVIPGGATLTFEVEVVKVTHAQ
jgi:FKBP-type peptidyl-prolyl cis-trans isomerase